MRFYWFGLGLLCVWRLTHLLTAEDGPWDVFVRLRRRAGSGFWAGLLDCFACLSLWMAAPFAYLIGEAWKERLLLWPSLSAAALLLERLTARVESAPPPARYVEDPEESDGVLREEKDAVSGRPPE